MIEVIALTGIFSIDALQRPINRQSREELKASSVAADSGIVKVGF
jgi:hypothetical protein